MLMFHSLPSALVITLVLRRFLNSKMNYKTVLYAFVILAWILGRICNPNMDPETLFLVLAQVLGRFFSPNTSTWTLF